MSLKELKKVISFQRLGMGALSVNLSNVITTPVYAAFLIIENAMLIYVIAIILKAQIS